jgi:multidrug resistance efflux pump
MSDRESCSVTLTTEKAQSRRLRHSVKLRSSTQKPSLASRNNLRALADQLEAAHPTIVSLTAQVEAARVQLEAMRVALLRALNAHQ